MHFLRFGEIPKNEKSINFLKMTNDQNDNFTYAFDIYGYGEALECVPEYAYEKGVSCFDFKNNVPGLDSIELLRSFCARIKDKCYIIEAKQISTGNDGEPLVKNVQIVEEWQTTEKERAQLAHNILCAMFSNVKNCRKMIARIIYCTASQTGRQTRKAMFLMASNIIIKGVLRLFCFVGL